MITQQPERMTELVSGFFKAVLSPELRVKYAGIIADAFVNRDVVSVAADHTVTTDISVSADTSGREHV